MLTQLLCLSPPLTYQRKLLYSTWVGGKGKNIEQGKTWLICGEAKHFFMCLPLKIMSLGSSLALPNEISSFTTAGGTGFAFSWSHGEVKGGFTAPYIVLIE